MSRQHQQQEIAKQFDLPERQSKIDSLFKQNEVYCICKTSESTSFMIACDFCEEWYHGHCMNLTKSEANLIKSWYCPLCQQKFPELEIQYKKPKSAPRPERGSTKKVGRPRKSERASDSRNDSTRCGSCEGCRATHNCGTCTVCQSKRTNNVCLKRICVDWLYAAGVWEEPAPGTRPTAGDDEDDWKPERKPAKVTKVAAKRPTPAAKKPAKRARRPSAQASKRRGKAKKVNVDVVSDHCTDSESDFNEEFETDSQCMGPQCTNEVRPASKYCSDFCGMRLATKRIYAVLPGRIQEWNLTPVVAEERDKSKLESNQAKQKTIRGLITSLENQRRELDEHIDWVHSQKVDPNEKPIEPDFEGYIYCITCGHEMPIKSSMKHMEKCYNKHESQVTFATCYITTLEGIPIFCDNFNPATKMFCKKLKVLCPEHTKEPKVGDDEICGYPKTLEMTPSTNLLNMDYEEPGSYCRLAKKKCNRHFCWEKLRRAEIDIERVRQWLTLEELIDHERQIKASLAVRGGAMGLMLHSTYDHGLRKYLPQRMDIEKMQLSQRIDLDPECIEDPIWREITFKDTLMSTSIDTGKLLMKYEPDYHTDRRPSVSDTESSDEEYPKQKGAAYRRRDKLIKEGKLPSPQSVDEFERAVLPSKRDKGARKLQAVVSGASSASREMTASEMYKMYKSEIEGDM